MLKKKTVRDLNVAGKKVLVRADLNVPLGADGKVEDDTRIRAVLPTIKYLLDAKARVILLTHLGRPKGYDQSLRVDPIATRLGTLLGIDVRKAGAVVGSDVKQAADNLHDRDVMLLENVRFSQGETENDPDFAKQLASLADIYVNDAFGACHRRHASIVGVTQFLPSVAGTLLEKEVNTLTSLLEAPARPFVAILGGNKVSDKLKVIAKFLNIVDTLLIGGGMCFTFFRSQGLETGRSLVEDAMVEPCKDILEQARASKLRFLLPEDVVVAEQISESVPTQVVAAESIPAEAMGLDIGPAARATYVAAIKPARTIFWNGPLGVFEMPQFAEGTRAIAEALAESKATTIVGGGDTDAALRRFGVEGKISFVSTGGGASLNMLEGANLPGIESLDDRRNGG